MAVATAEILDAISNMTVLELSQLIKDMEEKFGVSAAAAAVAVAPAAGGGGAAAPAAEEKTEFTVNLTAAGPNKVSRSQGSQGSRRRCAQAGEGSYSEGRRRGDSQADHRSRRQR